MSTLTHILNVLGDFLVGGLPLLIGGWFIEILASGKEVPLRNHYADSNRQSGFVWPERLNVAPS